MRNVLLLVVVVACGAPPVTPSRADDGDRLLGDDDGCPDAPEDEDQFEDEDGCPDPDDDGDGRLDADDLCPRDAEDQDGFEDEDGCPDPDNDEDRVLDAGDRCPNEDETYNGFDDEDGCPDRGSCTLEFSALGVPPVLFEASLDAIDAAGLEALVARVQTLRDASIRRLAVSAYAHLAVPREAELARRRAERVRDGLVAAGYDAQRLVLQVLDVSESDRPDRLQRVDLTPLCVAGEVYDRQPDGSGARTCRVCDAP